MKKVTLVAMVSFILLAFTALTSPLRAEDLASSARIHKKFKLLPGKADDRYVVYVPFEVTRPGRIRVYYELKGVDLKIDQTMALPSLILVDSRIFDKIDESTWVKICKTIVNYHPTLKLTTESLKFIISEVKDVLGKDEKPKWFHGSQKLLEKNTPLVLDVDDRNLRTTQGRYLVILRNPSPGEYHGNILISFPGNLWEVDPDLEAIYERKPDLAVERIELDADNRVVVTIINHGPGLLHKVRYNRERERVIRLNVEVDGKKMVSVPIAEVDPKYVLAIKGTPVTYRTDILLSQPARVMAVIDADDVVAEPDKRNNKKRENLTPRTSSLSTSESGKRVKRGSEGSSTEIVSSTPSGSPNPDLVVADIFLDNRRRVAVRVENRGGSISPDLYRANPPVQIHLLMNGRSWAYLPLESLDPAGRLKQPGGNIVWTSDHVLREAAEITVIVDEGNRLPEANEANNTLTRRLSP